MSLWPIAEERLAEHRALCPSIATACCNHLLCDSPGQRSIQTRRVNRGHSPAEPQAGSPTLDSKETVAGIAQAWQNITFAVKFLVDGGRKDGEVRIKTADMADALRGRNEVHQPDTTDIKFGEQIHCSHGAAARGEHGIDQDYLVPAQIGWQTFMIKDSLERGFLPFQPDKSNAGVGD